MTLVCIIIIEIIVMFDDHKMRPEPAWLDTVSGRAAFCKQARTLDPQKADSTEMSAVEGTVLTGHAAKKGPS